MLLLFKKTKQDFHLKDRTRQDRTGQDKRLQTFFFSFLNKIFEKLHAFQSLGLTETREGGRLRNL